MRCSSCEDFVRGKGCTSIMEEYCDGQRFYVPSTRMGFWGWVIFISVAGLALYFTGVFVVQWFELIGVINS